MSYTRMMGRPMRARIKAYRASGRMFGQTFHSGNAGTSARPANRVCELGYILAYYTDPCPCGRTFWQHKEAA